MGNNSKKLKREFFLLSESGKPKLGTGVGEDEKLPEISKTTVDTAGENRALGWQWRSSWRFAAQHHKNQTTEKRAFLLHTSP